MDLSEIFRLVNLAVGALMVVGGIFEFFTGENTVQKIILGAYVIIFGGATALLEFQIPPQVSRYANFMFSFIGRGIFYIFVGSIILHTWTLSTIVAIMIIAVGAGYCALEFIPSIEPPQNMRDASWEGGIDEDFGVPSGEDEE